MGDVVDLKAYRVAADRKAEPSDVADMVVTTLNWGEHPKPEGGPFCVVAVPASDGESFHGRLLSVADARAPGAALLCWAEEPDE